MKIFVIHSGSDSAVVQTYIERINHETVNTEVLMLNDGGPFWKIDAGKRIKQAQLVLVFVGRNSHKSKNIEWEINKAYSQRKQIVVLYLDSDYPIPPALMKTQNYTQEQHQIATEMSCDALIQYINSYMEGDYSLFNHAENEMDSNMDLLFEQYKMFLQTSEDLVNRRQSVSNFYISVNSAIIAIYSTVLAMSDKTSWRFVACLGFPLIGVILCSSWIKILRSYGNLNASKMRIISIIEKKLPASLYDAEWRIQSDKLNAKPYISFTEAEVKIPKLFIIVYSLIILSCLGFLAYKIFLIKLN